MKAIFSIFTLLLIGSTGFTQKQDVEIFEKKEGSKVIVMARNTGKVEYSVALNITSKGMDVMPSSKVETSIAPGFMKEMANLTPKPGESWEYSYDVTIAQSSGISSPNAGVSPTKASPSSTPTATQTREANSPTTTTTTTTTITPPPASPSPELSKADIILYTKPGCSRCAFVKKQLTSKGIAFEEYSTASDSPEINSMWAGLRNSGFTGGSVTMPVVRANGKYYYNIQDMQGFVDKLKK
jgi:glutaredoxin